MSYEKMIYRSLAIPVSAFDWLKTYQREISSRNGEQLTNNEVLTRIIKEHQQQHEESAEHLNDNIIE